MAEHNPFSAVGAGLELQARQNKVKAAIKKATDGPKPKPKKAGARKKQAQPLSEIKKTEHIGSEGETAYGQRMQDSPMEGGAKTRFNQSGQTDSDEY